MLTPPTQALLYCVSRDTKGAGELWGENLSRIGENIKAQTNILVRLARIKIKMGAFYLAPQLQQFCIIPSSWKRNKGK